MIHHRTMTPSDLSAVLDWAGDEGWNPGLDDAAAFHAADPGGFFLAADGDTPVAAISVVNHTENFAFLGLYLCRPDYRGQGIGLALWRHALAHAGGRTVGLDGVPAQQDNYKASGFDPAGATTRYTGTVPARANRALRPVRQDEIAGLIALEADASGVDKTRFLREWFSDTANRKTVVMDQQGQISGVATYRRCRNGYKIGPMIAPDVATATGLITGVAALAGGAEMSIDLPSGTPALDQTCLDLGMTPGFSTARMYKGQPPVAGRGIYCPSTLELG